jgi:predicted secreted protein
MYRIGRGNLERLEEKRRRGVPQTPATEPRNGAKNLSGGGAETLIRLVFGENLSVSEALRQVQAGAEPSMGRTRADRILRDERQRIADRATVPEAAARILRLLSLELAALERDTGPRDLDRLHKLAQTLGTVERLRPETGQTEETGLLSLNDQDQTQD